MSVQIGDVDSDGKPDIIALGAVLLNTSSVGHADSTSLFPKINSGGGGYAVGDLDGDGRLDVAAPGSDSVDVHRNELRASQTITFPAINDKAFGDRFPVSATASSGLPVAFSIASGPATIAGNTVTITGFGTVTVRASQVGDSNFNVASNVDQTVTVVGLPFISITDVRVPEGDKGTGNAVFSVTLSAPSNVSGLETLPTECWEYRTPSLAEHRV